MEGSACARGSNLGGSSKEAGGVLVLHLGTDYMESSVCENSISSTLI